MIDKTKAYRFNGDSERWEAAHQGSCIRSTATNDCIPMLAAERLHERGILLEYPELPGDDWEFCNVGEPRSSNWCDQSERWMDYTGAICPHCQPIYCRKKKPVYRSGIFEAGSVPSTWADGAAIYWTTDPEKGKELLK